MDEETIKSLKALVLRGYGVTEEEVSTLLAAKAHSNVIKAQEFFVTDEEQAQLEFATWLFDHGRISEGEA